MSKHKDHHHAEHHQQTATEPQAASASAPADIEALQKQLETLEAELADAKDKMLRYKAESDNTRRRASLDVENANKYGVEKFASEIINVVDSLDHGLQATSDSEQLQLIHLREGMELTHKLMLDTLAKFQIQVVDPKGQAFDPKLHEALSAQPSADVAPNTVLAVIQKGFLLHDRVLRPARVVVSKAP